MIKAVCFDLDGVYFKSSGFKEFKAALVNLGADIEKVDYVLGKSPEINKFKAGEMSADEFWKFAGEYWSIPKTTEEFMEIMVSHYEIDPEVETLRKSLKDKGYGICICSNNYTSRIEALDKKFNFLKDFDFYVFSYEAGALKPDKKVFQALVDRSKLQANEIAYSDDNPDRLQGAIELGIQAFVFEDFHQFKAKLVELGVQL
jgi:HAD superfamily hydrolase (TIGR01509 family)